jgi:hypothetical protein
LNILQALPFNTLLGDLTLVGIEDQVQVSQEIIETKEWKENKTRVSCTCR